MHEFIAGRVWHRLKELTEDATTIRAAIAYVSSDAYVKFGKGDILVVDASASAVSSGNTSATVLRRAYKRGAKLFSLPNLHAKLLVLDRVAVIGSANASESSAGLVEAAVLTDQPRVVSEAAGWIERLKKRATLIDEKVLKKILAIKVVRRGWKPGLQVRAVSSSNVPEHRTWIVGVHEMDDDEYPEEKPAIAKGEEEAKKVLQDKDDEVSWLRCVDNSLFTRDARPGDSVIVMSREKERKLPYTVCRHSPILRRQRESKCTRFFYESCDDGDDKNWKDFQALLKRAGVTFKVRPGTSRRIKEDLSDAIHSLWNKV